MEKRRVASIDMGSNSLRLWIGIIDSESVETLFKKKRVTRLATGVAQHQRLCEASMQASLETLKDFLNECAEWQVDREDIVCLATSACRDALNGKEFMQTIQEALGIFPKIISGEMEAQLSYIGAILTAKAGNYLVIDIGGGSTEFAYGTHESIELVESLNMGAVRLKELFFAQDEYDEISIEKTKIFIEGLMSDLEELKECSWQAIGVAGTIRTQLTLQEIFSQSSEKATKKLTQQAVATNFKRLKKMSLLEREQLMGKEADRADVIVVGTLLLLTIMEILEIEEMTVSKLDNLQGMQWYHELIKEM